MAIELKREILDLIESPELYADLLEHTERLRLRDYVSIIAGAPVSLERKQKLLHILEATSDLNQRDTDYMKLCCECMDQAVRHLTIESGTIFLIQLMGYDNNRSDIMDGQHVNIMMMNQAQSGRLYTGEWNYMSMVRMKSGKMDFYHRSTRTSWIKMERFNILYMKGRHQII